MKYMLKMLIIPKHEPVFQARSRTCRQMFKQGVERVDKCFFFFHKKYQARD